MDYRTRFAPSPTGYLHIGGVRTALFNFLFSRQNGGQYLLRIDDTDAARNVDEAIAPILNGFRWLGLTWDEGPEVDGPHAPYYQSQRVERHRQAVDRLLQSGHAYRDFATPEELQQQRAEAEAAGRQFVYDRRWMAETDDQAAAWAAEGRSAVVRLKMPREGNCTFVDLVRGPVEFAWQGEADHVIQRADGTCLYHLASVVDDHDLQISHVIRAVEHLPNTPRQIFIAQSLGYQLPNFAHLPYVAEPGGTAKLSKRKLDKYLKNPAFNELYTLGKGIAEKLKLQINPEVFNPVVVDFYREIGFLPVAVLNYLLLLGWSYDDSAEHFTLDEAIRHFSLERVQKSPASFDPQKLMAFQSRWMATLSVDEKYAMIAPMLQRAGYLPASLDESLRRWLQRVIELAGDRIRIAGEIFSFNELFDRDDQLPLDPTLLRKRLGDPVAQQLASDYIDTLDEVSEWQAAAIESHLNAFVAARSIKAGTLLNALRAALTGKASGLAVFEYIELLGRDSVRARVRRGVSEAAAIGN